MTRKILLLTLFAATFMRLWKLNEVPVSLFGDELDVGYHAYSILKTGKDYYGNPWPIHFHSIAEWRTPLYLYSAVPTVAFFGISPLGVRLPAVIFGVLCVWGIYLLVNELLSYKVTEKKQSPITNYQSLALIAAGILALSPWHIQYSRAAFEATELLAFLIFGLYFFFKSLKTGGFLWISLAFLTFTPWIYSTAKLFTPLLLIFLFLVWQRQILSSLKSNLLKAVLVGLVVGLPIAYSTIFAGGAQRAEYTSVFTNPTIEPEVGVARLRDAFMRKEVALGQKPNVKDRFFHNKVMFWLENISRNYFQAYSLDFLFVSGDPNLRHSIAGMGQFYKIELIPLILGLFFFFNSKHKREIKYLIFFWLVFGVLPAALTRDGGNHATRLILILPPLVFLIAYGIVETIRFLKSGGRFLFITIYLLFFTFNFIFYQHQYWVHNPWDSERWWHSGFKEAIQSIKEVEKDYNKVIISMAGEPAWIFFAGWYQYPPEKWQKEFPIGNVVEVDGFGKISHIGKFYFGTFGKGKESIYDLPKYVDQKVLYMANAKEIGANLIIEPERTPPGLKLVKSIAYPSGEPVFYLFTKS